MSNTNWIICDDNEVDLLKLEQQAEWNNIVEPIGLCEQCLVFDFLENKCAYCGKQLIAVKE